MSAAEQNQQPSPLPRLRLVGASKPTRAPGTGATRLRKGRYHYPKSLLRQAYFCLNGNGVWLEPRLSLSMVSNPKFKSPIDALLAQLEAEGHDVSGARIEWATYREQAGRLCEDFQHLANEIHLRFDALRRDHSVLAQAMYVAPTPGTSK